tara:strand:- start:618 stop:902 length:285 start_codon:yes stop_codon:yes gene_type:complete
MKHIVYLLITKKNNKLTTYVGYTIDLNKRLKLHNQGKGAKFTKGFKWEVIYHKTYKNKSQALIQEYKLKNDKKKRKLIKLKFLKKYENINPITL